MNLATVAVVVLHCLLHREVYGAVAGLDFGQTSRPLPQQGPLGSITDLGTAFTDTALNILTAGQIQNASSYTTFLFQSRQSGGNTTEVKVGDRDKLLGAGFNPCKLTKILIHGWLHNGSDLFSITVSQGFLDAYDVNVIRVNWPKLAMTEYNVAHDAVFYVGFYVADFVDFLVRDVGANISTIHVVGFSLGGQIAGITGENVVSGKLPRISGLDPAGPLFTGTDTEGRLDVSDAEFVDVIHTSAGTNGYPDPCGTVDFYVNGGFAPQPGCIGMIEPTCSHNRAFMYYAECISSERFIAKQCDDFWDYVTGACDNNGTAVMGYHVDPRSRGVFYLDTNAASPYAKS